MIGEMSYEEMKKTAQMLSQSSQTIRSIIENYDPDLNSVTDFCNSLDNYTKFLETSLELYQDSDEALKVMIEKNK